MTSVNSPDLFTTFLTENEALGRAIKALIPSKMEDDIYFTNTLDYAAKIENGGSRVKAPRGMMRINLTRFEALMAKHARRVNAKRVTA